MRNLLKVLVGSVLCCTSAGSAQAQALPGRLDASQLDVVPFADTPVHREQARALARFVCRDSSRSVRVVPLQISPDEPTYPDIPPGILAAFFQEVAEFCVPQSAANRDSWRIELIGFSAGSTAESTTVVWRSSSPLIRDGWTTDVWRAAIIRSGDAWAIDRPRNLMHDLYRTGR